MTIVLDGRKARDAYRTKLALRVKALADQGTLPRLAIIQVGDNRESSIYIEQKKRFAASIGAAADHVRFAADASQDTIAAKIGELNRTPEVHGIILQLPLPEGLDRLVLMNLIDPNKDVDGLTDENQKLLDRGEPRFVPATAKGVMLLLDFYGIDVKGKPAAVFGRSRLVGYPIAQLLHIRGASSVSVIHSKTEDAALISRAADIVIVAMGKPELVDRSYIKDGAVVVDVGINSAAKNGKVVGDVRYADVAPITSAISPVPGGVGPMTVLSLFDNLILSAERFSR
ncbi:bifunctional 5,10-methylenetetrahydrofolate dehydrogenase/5,10-methenyltetrahydrofolate cyclohydrolase [Candidatus Parcubacteria bacterium]|nr:bifunctional 5,10-methylenetetrahydrofolate dehydrogenase/5,10-methenyltetrahydrofolate cyclohydrolase [Candidatus Parcubacteria bacterium]